MKFCKGIHFRLSNGTGEMSSDMRIDLSAHDLHMQQNNQQDLLKRKYLVYAVRIWDACYVCNIEDKWRCWGKEGRGGKGVKLKFSPG